MADLFDRFTAGAKRALQLAEREALRLNDSSVQSAHVLVGLLEEGHGGAAKTLMSLGLDLAKVRRAIEFIHRPGKRSAGGSLGLAPRTKTIIELAVHEAQRLGHSQIGTEHLLLGLLRDDQNVAIGALEALGISSSRVRQRLTRTLKEFGTDIAEVPQEPSSSPPEMQVVSSHVQIRESADPDREGPTLRELVAVVPVAQAQIHAGTMVRIFSVELFTDGFMVHSDVLGLNAEPAAGEDSDWYPTYSFAVTDDQGCRYEQRGGGWSNDRASQWRFSDRFEPGVDPLARELRLEVSEVVWTHSVFDASGELQQDQTRRHHGPWAFAVTLPLA